MRILHRFADKLVSRLAPKATSQAMCFSTMEYCSPCNGNKQHTCCHLSGCIEVCRDVNC